MTAPQQPSADAAAQRKEQAKRGAEARHTNELRELATELARPELAFDPATIRKGTVVSIDKTGTPPTLGITLSGDLTITVSGVRFIESYSPQVNDTVLIIKQGTDVLVLGPVASQFSESVWTAASMSAGFSQGGNSQGNFEYRKVIDNGSPKMQFRGAVTRASGTVITVLPTGFRPSIRRTLITARDPAGGANDVRIDIDPNGNVVMVGGQTSPGAITSGSTTPGSTGSSTPGSTDSTTPASTGSTTPGNTGSVTDTVPPFAITEGYDPTGNPDDGGLVVGGYGPGDHRHGLGGHGHNMNPHSHTSAGHSHSSASHSHGHSASHSHTSAAHTHSVDVAVTDPAWVSLDGIEFFL